MINYVQPGDSITITNSTSEDILSGDLVVIGALIGVAATDILAGADGEISTEGVYALPKAVEVISQGDSLYFDSVSGKLTATPGTDSKPLVGAASAAAASDAATVNVKLGACGLTGPSA